MLYTSGISFTSKISKICRKSVLINDIIVVYDTFLLFIDIAQSCTWGEGGLISNSYFVYDIWKKIIIIIISENFQRQNNSILWYSSLLSRLFICYYKEKHRNGKYSLVNHSSETLWNAAVSVHAGWKSFFITKSVCCINY